MRVTPPVGLGRMLLAQLRSLVVVLLAVAAVVAFVAGDPADAAAIGVVLLINTALGLYMELRARRAFVALLHLDVARATVMRDGRPRDVDARTLVPGDVVRIEAGQVVPADARLVNATDLQVVESALTGESVPVLKEPERVVASDALLGDRVNCVFKGTTVASGRGVIVVTATGIDTEIGRIGGLVSALPDERTPLEEKLDQLGRRLALMAGIAAAVVALVGWARGLPLDEMIQTALALAVAAVPEGLPAVATITLAIGVHRMSRQRAIVRRLPSVETLGSVTVICTDKTGTLTAGEITATLLWIHGREIAIEGRGYAPSGNFTEEGRELDPRHDPAALEALRVGVLANRADLHEVDGSWEARGDPTEIALLVAGVKAGLRRAELTAHLPEVGEIPFTSERRWMATLHRAQDGGLHVFAKGAAAAVLERCTHASSGRGQAVPLDADGREAVLEADDELASRGLRVLALAKGPVGGTDERAVRDLTLVGLVGMIDPPAAGVRETIGAFTRAGIRTVMITGDQRRTAEAVARELQMIGAEQGVVDGADLDRMDDAELRRRLPSIVAFSRITPDAKLRLVNAYRNRGDIVAMLGDGVNDAAALRRADVGVAMGRRGTDVAKEAAAIVLQDDRFQTIGAAIEQGRVVFDNIRKFVFYLFTCNLAEVLILLVAGAALLPPLLPLQILWLNLVTDTFPAFALAVEPGEPDVMERPPRDPTHEILSHSFVRATFWYAFLIAAATLAALALTHFRDPDAPDHARTVAFMTLAFAQAFHLGTARSAIHVLGRHALTNRLALGAVLLVIVLQLAALWYDPLARALQTTPLDAIDWTAIVALSALPAIAGQVSRVLGTP
jgi:Ca2+-transporting ATPase